MSKIKITINNREVEAYEGQTVLEAAKNNGIHIPTLCYLKDVTGTGACRVCQVEVAVSYTHLLTFLKRIFFMKFMMSLLIDRYILLKSHIQIIYWNRVLIKSVKK